VASSPPIHIILATTRILEVWDTAVKGSTLTVLLVEEGQDITAEAKEPTQEEEEAHRMFLQACL